MEAAAFRFYCLLSLPHFVSFGRQSAVERSFTSLKDVLPPFSSRKSVQSSVTSIRSDSNGHGRFPRRNSAKDDENKRPGSPKPRKYNKEEMIALLRRIQSSIAKGSGSSPGTLNKNTDSSRDTFSAESIVEALRESRKPAKGKAAQRGVKVLRSSIPREPRIDDSETVADFKLSRPPSEFVKRSPIPAPTMPRVKVIEATTESKELELSRMEDMKLSELKVLAKAKGIRGYSKLRKSKLLALLKS